METVMLESSLWKASLGSRNSANHERLRTALAGFRDRVEKLLQPLGEQLPGLTVHDVSHLDALWRTASVIAGPDFDLNPAEAFVLGGAILLHDAAHVISAFEGGLDEIKSTSEWRDLIAQDFGNVEPLDGSEQQKAALFQVLRHLHARQAHRLATMSWPSPSGEDRLFLISDPELRAYYGALIGQIAESHHWPTHRVGSEFRSRNLPAPAFLQPDDWNVDALKVALLLRTADAAHIDSLRAPMFLFSLRNPKGVSRDHWTFQSRLSQPTRIPSSGRLLIAAGQPFGATDRRAWWLSFDTARMIDSEIRMANQLLEECNRRQLATIGVLDCDSPEAFAKHVPVEGWTPLDVRPKVGDVPALIAALGGAALYGNNPWVALRELVQNSIDAIHALRSLGGLDATEGQIDVRVSKLADGNLNLSVTDNGIGMSRYVLTDVMLDFGRSLWSSPMLRDQLPGLAASGFSAIGKFGIGFFSIFMIGDNVKVVTRRYEIAEEDTEDQWSLEFEDGLVGRPVLSIPKGQERLRRCGTSVSIRCAPNRIVELIDTATLSPWDDETDLDALTEDEFCGRMRALIAWIAPSADVRIRASIGNASQTAIEPGDWLSIDESELRKRIKSTGVELFPLTNGENRVIGRIGIDSIWSRAESAVTINGVRNGSISGIAGVCEASDASSSAARTDSRAAGTLTDWQKWAETVLSAGAPDISAQARLHPLLSHHDLPVWTLNGEPATAADVAEFIADKQRVLLMRGELSHESSDDVAESRFVGFKYTDSVVAYPLISHSNLRSLSDFAVQAGAKPINYVGIFDDLVRATWGDFVESDDFAYVGEVEGTDIERSVVIYERPGLGSDENDEVDQ